MIPDQQTIDRVCVGLAELVIKKAIPDRVLRRLEFGLPAGIPNSWLMLLDLLGIPESLDCANGVLDDHQGTPEELVKALRELAEKEAAKGQS